MSKDSLAPKFGWQDAIAESDLSPTTRHVAWAVSMYVNSKTSTAWPGANRLARDTGLHVSTVRERLSELVEKGWLERKIQGGKVGEERTANVYALSTPAPLAHGDPSSTAPDPSPTAMRPLATGDPNQEEPKGTKTLRQNPYSDDFEDWWSLYPRKVGKTDAFSAYKARRKDGVSHDRLVLARDKYALSRLGESEQFTMHASRFLKREGPWSEWESQPEPDLTKDVWGVPDEPRLVLPPARVDVCPVCESSVLACVCGGI